MFASVRLLAFPLVFVLASCASEVSEQIEPVAEALLSSAPAEQSRHEVGLFTGAFDVDTGEFRVEMVQPDALGTDFRTDRQAASFCNDFRVNVFGLGVGINTVAGSVGDTVADCIPAAEALAWSGLQYAEGGAFCATIRIDNRLENTLSNVMAEITTITSGYEGYTFLTAEEPACCGTGADVSGYAGERAPTDIAGGVFYHAESMATDEAGEEDWIFRNAGGSFTFSGRIVANVEELPNALDDDCDGRVDNALNLYPDAGPCRADNDCVSGLCTDVSVDDGFGVCAATCAPGSYGLSCTACGSCGSGVCVDGAAGDGSCECDEGFGGTACDDCLPGVFGAACDGTCPECGDHGACADGVAGSGACECDGGWAGPACETQTGVTSPLCGGGWTRVALEFAERPVGGYGATNRNGLLRFLGVVSGDASAISAGTGEGNVGANFQIGIDYNDVMVTWGTNYACGTPAGEIFTNTVVNQIPLAGFETNDSNLAAYSAGPGAVFCRGAATWRRPGDSSWAIKPANDPYFSCGCNSGSWAGRGAFYGGTASGQQTSCAGWGGGFVGWVNHGQAKGAYYPGWDTAIWIR